MDDEDGGDGDNGSNSRVLASHDHIAACKIGKGSEKTDHKRRVDGHAYFND